MASHYKRFHAIRKLFFPNKTAQEVVEYYYFWKVTTDVEPQKEFDSSQSEESDEVADSTSSQQATKRKRDAFQDSFNESPAFTGGWDNFDTTRRGDFISSDEVPPPKRTKTDDFRTSTDSFFAREESFCPPMHSFHKPFQQNELFSNSGELPSWNEFLTLPPYTPVSMVGDDPFLSVDGGLGNIDNMSGMDDLNGLGIDCDPNSSFGDLT
eukprot:TRINITY_DN1066_c0_g1_i2.p2 TRINITY_DN1066_c0_g1~~TRINITY_DN1066_c0_g1_i2.p2  ORF type:complete len:210 (+),score=30.19 TRINITY_DN1066_c0_g1_i2:697-1326(+)